MTAGINFKASAAVRAALSAIGRTEDLRFSPDNRLLAIAIASNRLSGEKRKSSVRPIAESAARTAALALKLIPAVIRPPLRRSNGGENRESS